jgi:hypothetical protein
MSVRHFLLILASAITWCGPAWLAVSGRCGAWWVPVGWCIAVWPCEWLWAQYRKESGQ